MTRVYPLTPETLPPGLSAVRPTEGLVPGDDVVAAAHVEGPRTFSEDEPPDSGDGRVLELASRPRKALSTVPWEGREDVRRSVVVPVAHAERFIVSADHLRRVRDGGRIALGVPA